MKEEKYAKKIKSNEKSNPAKETKKSSPTNVTENKSVERATQPSEQVVKPDTQKQQSSKSPTYNAATMLQNANKEMIAKKRRRNTAIGVTAGILLATAIIVPAVYLNGKVDINVSIPTLQQDESFSVVVKRGFKVGDLQPKEIEGYTFEGFYKDANLTERYSDDDKITKDITIYAKYTANVYAITFPSSPYFTIEGEDIENNKAYAEYDSSYSFRVKLSAGYTESDIHVYLGETELIPVDGVYTITIKGDSTINITGVEINTYSVVYYDEDAETIIHSEEVDYNTASTYTDTPEKPADNTYTYTFSGWVYYDSGEPITDELTHVINNIKVKASYTATYIEYSIGNIPTQVTIQKGSETLTNLDTLHYGDTVDISYTPTTGYDMTSFNVSGATLVSGDTYRITGNLTVTYTETIQTYTITIESSNTEYGTVDTTCVTVEYGSTISETFNELRIGNHTIVATTTADTPEYDYTFTGWTYSSSTVTGEMTIVANFVRTMDEYIVTIESSNVDYGSVDRANLVVNYNTPIIVEDNTILINGVTITASEKEDTAQYTYTFTGWTNATDPITGNRTIIANFERSTNSYTVTFYDENKSTVLASQYAEYGTAVEYTGSTPTKPADNTYTYTFSHWETAEGEEYDISSETITGDISVYAQYTATYIEYTVDNPYTQVTILHDGSPVNDGETLHYGDTVEITCTPTEGYEMTEFTVTGADRVDETDTYTVTGNLEIIYEEIITVARLDFTIENGVVTGYTGSDTNVVIPSTYSISNGLIVEGTDYTVTGIGESAFEGNASITSITIPESVASIDDRAFYDCAGLRGINFNATNMSNFSSNNGVFAYAGKNSSGIVVNIGANVTRIPANLFYTSYSNSSPNIVSVNFEEGTQCTEIGERAFYECDSVTTVTFGENSQLESIGERAFSYCSSLTSITIPEGVTSIGQYAFNNCTGLTEINFNATNMSDLSSGNRVFYNAGQNGTGITVNIGANVTRIPAYLFYPYGNSSSSPNIISVDFAEGSQCTEIGDYAFRDCSSLTSITIPENVISIGKYAFYKCTELIEINFNATNMSDLSSGDNVFYNAGKNSTGITVNIGANVTRIPAYLFYQNSGSSYSPNIISVNFEEESKCSEIGARAFSYSSSFTSITIPSSVTSIGSYAFSSCTSLSTVAFAENSQLESMGEYVFSYCSSLTSIIIPENVTSIGNRAFDECTGLTEINFNATNMSDLSSNNYVFYNAGEAGTGIVVNIGANVTRIPAYLFCPYGYDSNYSPNVVTVNFEEGSQCTEIGDYAFFYLSNLTSITIPENVTNLGNNAFSNCSSLTIVTFGENSQLTSIGNYAFSDCSSLTSITIPENVTSIGNGTFSSCTGIMEINFNATNMYDLSFGSRVFSNAGEDSSGIIVNIGANVTRIPAYLFCPAGSAYSLNIISVNFEEDSQCTEIGNYAFSSCSSLTSINIPSSVTSIGSQALDGCSSLTTATFGDNSQLESIGDEAFRNCSSLTSITIPENVTSIGGSAFYNCTGLSEINFKVTNMSDLSSNNGVFAYAGKNSSGITVNIGANVTRIPAYLFNPSGSSNSPNITSVNFEEGSQCTEIRNYAFRDCSSLTSITIPEGVTSIGNGVFWDCTGLTEINFNATNMPDLSSNNYVFFNAGKNGTGIAVNIGANVTRIPAYLYNPYNSSSNDSPNILSVNFAEDNQCTEIGDYAFAYSSSLTSITIPSSVTSMGDSVFSGCSSLVEVVNLSNQTFNVGDYGTSTSNNPILEIITDESDTKLFTINGNLYKDYNGERYFIKNIDGSTEIEIDSSATQIYQYAFSNRPDIISVIIPSSVTSIGSSAFSNCSSLTAVTFKDNSQLESIGTYAFYRCSSLTSITIPESVTSIGMWAFSDCNSLQYNTFEGGLYLGNIENPYLVFVDTETTDITELTIHSDCKIINNYAFEDCTGLTSIMIPSSVTSIGDNAFYNCSSLTAVTFGEDSQLTSIGIYAFSGCSSLTSITIPSSVISIRFYAFRNCSNLTSVIFENTEGWYRTTSSTATSGTSVIVTNPAQNATYLTDTYDYYYWKRNA